MTDHRAHLDTEVENEISGEENETTTRRTTANTATASPPAQQEQEGCLVVDTVGSRKTRENNYLADLDGGSHPAYRAETHFPIVAAVVVVGAICRAMAGKEGGGMDDIAETEAVVVVDMRTTDEVEAGEAAVRADVAAVVVTTAETRARVVARSEEGSAKARSLAVEVGAADRARRDKGAS